MAPVLAPVRVATMLVASVVPRTMVLVAARSSGRGSPTCAASREMHSTTPTLGSAGVLSALAAQTSCASLRRMPSVKVPPQSTEMR